GATNIKVTSVANISASDTIRLDIDSVGHGIETVTVTRVGTQASRTALSANASAGATTVNVRSVKGLVVGDTLTVGTPANRDTVTITAVRDSSPTGGSSAGGGSSGGSSSGGGSSGASSSGGGSVDVTPALAKAHISPERVVAHGTGLDLAAPLRFTHAANLPF